MRLVRFSAALLLALALSIPATALAAGPRDAALNPPPSTVYAGVSNVGVFRDTGPTDSWTGLTALPSTSGTLALATGDSAHWRDVCVGLDSGVDCSHDSGATWSAGLSGHAVHAVLIASAGAQTVFAGAERLYRSDDGGRTWLTAGITRSVNTLAQAPGSLYAGGNGRVWVSHDNGQTWAASSGKGLPSRLTINGLAVKGTTLYAATSEGVWQTGGGGTWTQAHALPVKAVTALTATPSRVVALVAGDGLYASADGQTWSASPVPGLTGTVAALAQDQDPQQPNMLVVGDTAGAVRWSQDGGQTWSALGSTVAGNDGNAISALAIVQRMPLPVDAVADPHQATSVYANGHTVSAPFLTYWQARADVLGAPETQAFTDTKHLGATAQYFQNGELLQTGSGVTPAPLGAEQQPVGGATHASYTPDPHFIKYWTEHGGQKVFGSAVSPLLNRPIGDGTGRSYLVQYFRNARLEYRPTLNGYVVAPGNLGDQALQAMGWL